MKLFMSLISFGQQISLWMHIRPDVPIAFKDTGKMFGENQASPSTKLSIKNLKMNK